MSLVAAVRASNTSGLADAILSSAEACAGRGVAKRSPKKNTAEEDLESTREKHKWTREQLKDLEVNKIRCRKIDKITLFKQCCSMDYIGLYCSPHNLHELHEMDPYCLDRSCRCDSGKSERSKKRRNCGIENFWSSSFWSSSERMMKGTMKNMKDHWKEAKAKFRKCCDRRVRYDLLICCDSDRNFKSASL